MPVLVVLTALGLSQEHARCMEPRPLEMLMGKLIWAEVESRRPCALPPHSGHLWHATAGFNRNLQEASLMSPRFPPKTSG